MRAFDQSRYDGPSAERRARFLEFCSLGSRSNKPQSHFIISISTSGQQPFPRLESRYVMLLGIILTYNQCVWCSPFYATANRAIVRLEA